MYILYDKTRVLSRQFGEQDEASKPGLEPTTHPQAGRPAKVLAAEKVFAVIILKLDAEDGFEPPI